MPEVGQLEASIATLKEEIDTRKAAVADKEALLANHNPPIFQAVQVCPLLLFADVLMPYLLMYYSSCFLLYLCPFLPLLCYALL